MVLDRTGPPASSDSSTSRAVSPRISSTRQKTPAAPSCRRLPARSSTGSRAELLGVPAASPSQILGGYACIDRALLNIPVTIGEPSERSWSRSSALRLLTLLGLLISVGGLGS